MLIPHRTLSEFSRNAPVNNPRFDECVDPLHSYRWDPHIRMALRSIQILTYRGDGDIWARNFPFIQSWDLLLMQQYTISIGFAPGYSSPSWPTPSWGWVNHGTWAGGRGCSRLSLRLAVWLGLLYLVRLALRLGTLKLLGIMRVSSVSSLLLIQVDLRYFFRNCYPRWDWYVVIYTVSHSTEDARKDMIGTTKVCKRLELDHNIPLDL